jgi:hypothetical protein
VFINYRQRDASGALRPEALLVEALAERLTSSLGENTVYLDTTLRPGAPYADALRARLADTAVLIVIIHPGWLADIEARAGRRMDWVHEEISAAVQAGIRLLPVVLDGAELPDHARLPPAIRALADFQAVHVRFGAWEEGIAATIAEIELIVAPEVPEQIIGVAPLPDRGRRVVVLVVLFTCVLISALGTVIRVLPQLTAGLSFALGAAVIAVLGMLYLAVILALSVCRFTVRRSLVWLDERLAEVPDREFRVYGAGAFVVTLALSGLAIGKLGISVDVIGLIEIAVFCALAAVGMYWLRQREITPEWPYPPPRPTPTWVRKALFDLERHLAGDVQGWAAPLTLRRQRETQTAMAAIRGALETMSNPTADTLRGWWRTRSPWVTVPACRTCRDGPGDRHGGVGRAVGG